jgi:CHAD domain-containing protein
VGRRGGIRQPSEGVTNEKSHAMRERVRSRPWIVACTSRWFIRVMRHMDVRPPSFLAASYVADFLRHLPAVRNGDIEGVHQARVATRRLREVAPLLMSSRGREAEEWTRLARRAGRRLGRVRELDVMDEVLSTQEARVPAVAPVAAVARRTLVGQRQRARRQLIKALERLEVERLGEALPMTPSRWDGLRERYVSGPWATMLRERLGKRASSLREAVDHATGIYFPKRVHRTRIAVKKLRYAVEIADATGMWRPRNVLRDLKRVQATLGRIHDLQVLSEALSDLVDDESLRPNASVLSSAIKGEVEAEFATYLADRDRVLAICDVSERFASPRRPSIGVPSRRIAAVSALAVQVGVLLLSGGKARRSSDGGTADSSSGSPAGDAPPQEPSSRFNTFPSTASKVGG